MRKPSPSDLTDEQGEIIKPLIPVHAVGRPRTVEMREVLNVIFSLNRSGCQWDMFPDDLPPRSTVHDDSSSGAPTAPGRRSSTPFAGWSGWPPARSRAPAPGAADSPTVKATEIAADRDDDGGRKVTGRKIVVDTLGWLLVVVVTAASADDGPRPMGSARAGRARTCVDHRHTSTYNESGPSARLPGAVHREETSE